MKGHAHLQHGHLMGDVVEGVCRSSTQGHCTEQLGKMYIVRGALQRSRGQRNPSSTPLAKLCALARDCNCVQFHQAPYRLALAMVTPTGMLPLCFRFVTDQIQSWGVGWLSVFSYWLFMTMLLSVSAVSSLLCFPINLIMSKFTTSSHPNSHLSFSWFRIGSGFLTLIFIFETPFHQSSQGVV